MTNALEVTAILLVSHW